MLEVSLLALSFLIGAIPFSNIAARRLRGVDLREVGSGTVSGSNLYRVAGFVPLAITGVLDIGKGAFGPAVAGSDRPVLAAAAGGAAVIGHNWSPYLRGSGGRGLAPAIGALLVVAWPGTVLLFVGLILGRLSRQTGLGAFVAIVLLTPLLAVLAGATGAFAGLAIAVPLLAKRLLGNERASDLAELRSRLLFDRDLGS